MADEITVIATLRVSNGQLSERWSKSNLKVDQSAARAAGSVQIIGTGAHEAIVLTDITTAGYAFFKNLEAAGGNFVEIGVDVGATFYPFVKLKAGEVAVLRLGTNAPYAKADTGNVNLQVRVMED